jgi:hypothetical protein
LIAHGNFSFFEPNRLEIRFLFQARENAGAAVEAGLVSGAIRGML